MQRRKPEAAVDARVIYGNFVRIAAVQLGICNVRLGSFSAIHETAVSSG